MYQQLRAWYRWKASSNSGKIGGRRTRNSAKKPKEPSRTSKVIEMYSKLYYEDKVKPRTTELIKQTRDENDGVLPVGGAMTCMKQALVEVFSQEPDSVIDEVKGKIDEAARLKAESRALPAHKRTPEHFLL